MPRSKRHKKMKAIDPFCTGNRKALLLAKEQQFNNTPKNLVDQEVPRSLKDMLQLSKMAEERQKHKVVQKVGSLERISGETHNHFMKRVGRKAREKLNEEKTKVGRDNPDTLKIKKEMTEKKKERIVKLQQRLKGKKFERTIDATEKDFYKDHVEFGRLILLRLSFQLDREKAARLTNPDGENFF